MKRWNKMHFNVNHALLNNYVHKGISKFSKMLMWYKMIVGWKTCDLWLTCNWFNQNIKSLSNVKFEIKS